MPFIKDYNGYKHFTDNETILKAVEENTPILWFEDGIEAAAHLNNECPLDFQTWTWFADAHWVGIHQDKTYDDIIKIIKANPGVEYTLSSECYNYIRVNGITIKSGDRSTETITVCYLPDKAKKAKKRQESKILNAIKKPAYFNRSVRLIANEMSRAFTRSVFGYGLYSSPQYDRTDELSSIKHFLKVFDLCKKHKISMNDYSTHYYARRFIPLIKEYSMGNDEQKKFARCIKYLMKANKGKATNA